MCNKGIECIIQQQSDNLIDQTHHRSQAVVLMDSPTLTTGSNDDNPRVKFLCSFSGSILPRPQDGKLRYVGGETRIVSLPRDIGYDELMVRMRELYEGATLLKYQQPDEDLDALVSVVNDDDVTNMMEEYDKLGSGDGFTRLRIFLFSYPDQDVSSHFDADERDTERRYVDALNSINDMVDFRKLHNDSPLISPGDEMHVGEQYYHPMSLEGGLNNQRSFEIPMSQFNPHHLTIPHLVSGQHQNVAQRYNEMEAPWSPAYYSPRHHTHHEPRPMSDYPTSPSSSRYHRPPFGEDSHQHIYEHHQSQFSDNVVWLPSGVMPSDKAGFPGNLLHGPNHFEGNSICEQCRISFQKNQVYPESSTGNGFHHVAGSCAECLPNRETFNHERGWIVQQQLNPRADYIVDGSVVSSPLVHGTIMEPHHGSSNFVHHEDPRLIRGGSEVGPEVFHDQSMASGHQMHIPPTDERGVRYTNLPYGYGNDPFYQVPHGHVPAHTVWRPLHGGPSHESSSVPQQGNGSVNPRFCIGVENQNTWVDPSQKMLGFNGSLVPEYPYASSLKLNSNQNNINLENQPVFTPEPVRSPPGMLSFATDEVNGADVSKIDLKSTLEEGKERNVGTVGEAEVVSLDCLGINFAKPVEESGDVLKLNENDNFEETKLSAKNLSFLPELIASVKQAALEGAEEVKARAQEEGDAGQSHDSSANEASLNELESPNALGELEPGSESDSPNISKIEPTKAEAEAIARGLQTIKNDDLEEIRELGSGTYGAVFHGKWKGSDVAVKRIKASCFSGRPSERERLIADFWKEALLLSSLHHPNVVSFYGIVRDGPDGSLATVTEFMINGSLKQFLQKKDRTIDRRKRLIIGMDAAFGMEYLHGKNIVHFDLKCENLLVNMRDPHRPVCKIGDLGLSKVKQHTLVSGGVRGTLPWMAPELLSGKSNMVTEKIDVYSFGVVMWELLTGDEPYADMHCASIIGGIVNNSLRPQIPTWCDPEWKSLMEGCWSSDPAERPSFSEISQKLRNMAAAMNLK